MSDFAGGIAIGLVLGALIMAIVFGHELQKAYSRLSEVETAQTASDERQDASEERETARNDS